jgi:hypothetical protein
VTVKTPILPNVASRWPGAELDKELLTLKEDQLAKQWHSLLAEVAGVLRIGIALIREWHGNKHQMNGFMFNGRRFQSLSNIACEITGTRWSGPLFFGLKDSRGNNKMAPVNRGTYGAPYTRASLRRKVWNRTSFARCSARSLRVVDPKSGTDCVRVAHHFVGSAIIRLRRAHRGRTDMSSASSARSGANLSTLLVVFDEAQLRRVLKNYASYYNQVRTHLSLDKNTPDFRLPQKLGAIASHLNSRWAA